ncbi:MAG: hypothetical protein HYZ28_04405 [Myxococcales bacterium]|nr:hypothetical protein [Myxococcales bacterium]
MVKPTCAALLVLPALCWAQPAAPTPAPAAEASPLRFRAGLNAGAGTFLPGPMIAFALSARAGVQLNDLAAVFLDVGNRAGFMIGLSIQGSNVSQSVSGLGYWHFGLLGELTVGNQFFVAGGPMFARGGWGSVQQEVIDGNVSQFVVAAGGDFFPGADLRLGIGLGKPLSSGRRQQFTIALDCQFVFAKVISVSQQAGSGGVSQSIKVGNTMMGTTPQLVLGYEWK